MAAPGTLHIGRVSGQRKRANRTCRAKCHCVLRRSPLRRLTLSSSFRRGAIRALARPRGMRDERVGRLLSPEDVAVRCGLSRRAVYRAIERGDLLASRLCHRLRIRPADVDAWIEGSRVARERPTLSPSVPPVDHRGLRRLLAEE